VLQVVNNTPFKAALSVFPDPAGVETAYITIKATFAIGDGEPVLADKQVPLMAMDTFWGDATATSLRAAGDIALPRPATDILLVGSAIAPSPDTRVADVRVRVGPVSKTLRVFGDRVWQDGLGGLRPSLPQVWTQMPLRWERAFGGVAVNGADAPPSVEARNPVGCGLVGREASLARHSALPNLEDPRALVGSPKDRPAPACFAPVAPAWLPRRAFAGTYDEAWVRGRAPYLPDDFDSRFFQLAPQELVTPSTLEGGEPVELIGFAAQGVPIRFQLPYLDIDVDFEFGGDNNPSRPRLEMVLFEPDSSRFQMLWRGEFAVDKHLTRLGQVVVDCGQYDASGKPKPPLARLRSLPAAYANAE
jgi:hypothetical protein